MRTYKTSEIAKHIGIHANTVRLYEDMALIPKPERRANGYRVFTPLHLEQIKLVRMALSVEVLQNGLRKQAVSIIKTAAAGAFTEALRMTDAYAKQIDREILHAEEALCIVRALMQGENVPQGGALLSRKEVAQRLQISMDAIRNWEMNGLLSIKRRQNGYRMYSEADMRHLAIIRSLRCGNYSLAAILRMLHAVSSDPGTDIRRAIDTPDDEDDIISVCDRLLTSLQFAKRNAADMQSHLLNMQKQFGINPPL